MNYERFDNIFGIGSEMEMWFARCKLLLCILCFVWSFSWLIASLEPYAHWNVMGAFVGMVLSILFVLLSADLRNGYIFWCLRKVRLMRESEKKLDLDKPNSEPLPKIPHKQPLLPEMIRAEVDIEKGKVHSTGDGTNRIAFTFSSNGLPVSGASVVAVFPDSQLEATTDKSGKCMIHSETPVVCLLAAHPDLPPIYIDNWNMKGNVSINWVQANGVGSLLCTDFCKVPGFNGSLGVEQKFGRNFIRCGPDGMIRFLDFKSNMLTSSLMFEAGTYLTAFDNGVNCGTHVKVVYIKGTFALLEYSKKMFNQNSTGTLEDPVVPSPTYTVTSSESFQFK